MYRPQGRKGHVTAMMADNFRGGGGVNYRGKPEKDLRINFGGVKFHVSNPAQGRGTALTMISPALFFVTKPHLQRDLT